MYEFEIYNNETNERMFMHGYDRADAWRRNPGLDPKEWKIVASEYID